MFIYFSIILLPLPTTSSSPTPIVNYTKKVSKKHESYKNTFLYYPHCQELIALYFSILQGGYAQLLL